MPNAANPLPVAGYWHHTAAVGELVASLYRLSGTRERPADPHDGAPGVSDVAGVINQLNTKALNRVVSIDATAGLAYVEAGCTIEQLTAVCLSRGLVPAAVPAPARLTVGGAIVRTSAGSDALRSGTFGDSLAAVDLLTASGQIVTTRPNLTTDEDTHPDPSTTVRQTRPDFTSPLTSDEDSDPDSSTTSGGAKSGPTTSLTSDEDSHLWSATIGGRGATGLVVAATVRLIPAAPFVATRTIGFNWPHHLTQALNAALAEDSFGGEPVDYAEAVATGPGQMVLNLGRTVDDVEAPFLAVNPSRYRGLGLPYAASLTPGSRDLMSMADYLSRWDADEFWHSYDFGVAHRPVRNLWPAPLRRPAVYARLDQLRETGLARRFESLTHWRPGPPRVYREVALPLDRLADFLSSAWSIAPGVPIWITPLKHLPEPDSKDRRWPGQLPQSTAKNRVSRPQTELTGPGQPPPSAERKQPGVLCGIWGPGAHLCHDHNLGAEAALDRLATHLGGYTVRSRA